MKAKDGSARSSRNPLPVISETSDQFFSTEPAAVQDNDQATGATQDNSSRRCSKHMNAGTGGHIKQLEKIGQAIEDTPLPKACFTIPDDEPINMMAPTPHRPRKKKVSKALARANSKVSRHFILMYNCSLTSCYLLDTHPGSCQ